MDRTSPPRQIEQLASFLEVLEDGVAVVDATGRQIWTNRAFCELVGWPRSVLVGSVAPHLYWPPEETERISEALEQTVVGRPREFELTFMRRSGERFPVAVLPAPVTLGGDQFYVATVKDLTDTRAREKQLKNTKDFLDHMLAGGDLASWEHDIKKRSARVSDSYFTMLGYEPNSWDPSYEEWAKRVHPDDIGSADHNMQRLLLDQARVYEAEHRMLAADGSWRWVLTRGYITERSEDGSPSRIAGTMQDTHRLKTQERKLHQLQQMELLGALAGGLAHDLRNSLFVIATSVDAARTAASVDLDRYHGRIDEAVGLATGLVDSLLRNVGTSEPTLEVVEFNAFLTDSWDLIGSTVPRNVSLTLEPSEQPCPAEVDRLGLEHAMLNLVLNARDAIGSRGGTISVRLKVQNLLRHDVDTLQIAQGPYVLLEVVDDGAGMSAEVLERAVEPLFTTKSHGKGTGLGLSMARKFALDSEGFLKLMSTEGEGTTVMMGFPLRVELPPIEDVSVPPAAAGIRGEETILAVDDEGGILATVAAYLSSLGYHVVTASNPRQALAELRESKCDLLLTDVVMPFTLDGIDLARAARAIDADLPVLFMTGYLDQEQRLLTDPIGSVIRKPFTIEGLGAVVRSTLDQVST